MKTEADKYTLIEVLAMFEGPDAICVEELQRIRKAVERFACQMRDKLFDKAAAGYSGCD